MKVWATKYALSTGLEELEVETFQQHPHMVRASGGRYFYGEGKEWHRTRESALARCEVMRTAKLKSLDKTRKRIESLRFDQM